MVDPLLLVGFVADDELINEDNFVVRGNNIGYKSGNTGSNDNYTARNPVIYPKIIIDRKLNHCSNYFKHNKLVLRTRSQPAEAYYNDGEYFNNRECTSKWGYGTSFNYYLFNDISAPDPVAAANTIFVLCKYRQNETFKYVIFKLHELTPEK